MVKRREVQGVRTGRSVVLGCCVLLAVAVGAACDQVPLVAPTGSVVVISAGTRTLPLGGSTEIVATVTESSGTAVHDGTLVRFSTTLGAVSPVEAETRNGIATTTLQAGNVSGTAQVRAVSGGATGSTGTGTNATTTNVVEVQIGSVAFNALTMSASPTSLGANGGTSTVVAVATDASGNRVGGVPVTFTTTAGSLSASTVTTDSSGEARVFLTTTRSAKVSAAALGKTAGPLDVTVGSPATVSMTLSPSSGTTTVGAPVTATIKTATGTSARVTLNWGDGRIDDLGVVTADGRTATHSYASAGTFTITASGTADGDTFTTSAAVTITSAGVTLEVSPTSTTVSSPVTATVTPATGTSPRVTIDWGDGTSDPLGTIGSARSAVHSYSSSGTFTITATATTGTDTFQTSKPVTVTPKPAINVNITPSSTTPDKCSPVTFTADPGTGESIARYQWTIDGSDAEDQTIETTGTKITKVFSSTGTKTVTVTATATDGRQGNGQTSVVVKETTPPSSCNPS